MHCPECKVNRPNRHMYCFDCGTLLKADHQGEFNETVFDFVARQQDTNYFEELQAFVDSHPEIPYGQKLLGNHLFHKGKLIAAESHLRIALDLEPDNIDFLYDLSIVLYYQSRMTEALSTLKRVLELDSSHSAAHYRIGLTYYHLGEYEQGVKHLKECTSLTPDYIMGHYHLGVIYSKMGMIKLAIKEFGYQLDKNLKDAAAWNHLDKLFEKNTVNTQFEDKLEK